MDAFDDGIVTMDPDSNEELKLIIEKKEVQKKKKPTDVERVCFHGSSVLDATPLNENEMGESTEEELDAIPDAEERYRRRKRYEEVNRSGRRKLRRKLTPMSTDQ